jgi:hypothetical protein
MRKLIEFWRGEDGSVVATEWVVIATILMLGAAAGLVAARAAVLSDLSASTTSR